MTKTHSKARYFAQRFNVSKFKEFPYMHAEVSAISKLWGKHYITGKEKLVVVRFKNDGWAMAKPCPDCRTILDALGINEVFWTSEKGIWET